MTEKRNTVSFGDSEGHTILNRKSSSRKDLIKTIKTTLEKKDLEDHEKISICQKYLQQHYDSTKKI